MTAIAEGKSSHHRPTSQQTFEAAFAGYIAHRKLYSAEKTYSTDEQRSKPLLNFFGEFRLKRITAEMIEKFQQARAKSGVSGRTINLEVGLLRRILKRAKQWGRLAEDVKMLPERPKEARVLSTEEKENLIRTGTPQAKLASSPLCSNTGPEYYNAEL